MADSSPIPNSWIAYLLYKTEGPFIKDLPRYEQIHEMLSDAQREDIKLLFEVSNRTFLESYSLNMGKLRDLKYHVPKLGVDVFFFESMVGRRIAEIEDQIKKSASNKFDDAAEDFVGVLKGINTKAKGFSEGLEDFFVEFAKREKYFDMILRVILPP
ncbi:MAG: hypothetical protein L6R42_001680 [Xanthoria sp. 1 TBL-2021]|nr:MAG: hypothetical protein L6R42_001680 [Xanthoria sp. 1 TBL-2021]